MTTTSANALVLGGTGKTGSRLAAKLAKLGLNVRTAARHGADFSETFLRPVDGAIAVPTADANR